MSTSTTPAEPMTELDPQRAWEEYLRAARQLDAVRRYATATGTGTGAEPAPAVRAAREELTRVRARLLPQRSRLLQLGVPEAALRPTAAEVTLAGRGVPTAGDEPLAAVRRTGAMADAVDAAIAGRVRPAGRAWLPRLLVVGPLVLGPLMILSLLVCAGLATVWITR